MPCYYCPPIGGFTLRSYLLAGFSPPFFVPLSAPQRPSTWHYFQGFFMAKQHSPDGGLVYLHCSSIFSGANAQVRKVKKVSRLLEKHKASIKLLTAELTLPAIAAIAKELLEEKIFESLPSAKLRYPELFQLTETQEAREQRLRQRSSRSRLKQHKT